MSKNTKSQLGTDLKADEKKYEKIISKKEHIIVRVDGHKFSKFTRVFNKPFDKLFSEIMIRVTESLMAEFKATTGYTQSDEITLIIPSFFKDNDTFTHNLGGRTQKITSLISAKATIEFIKQFFKLVQDTESEFHQDRYINLITNGHIFEESFDARAYGAKTMDRMFNSVLWRVRDAEKNSISNLAISHISHKALLKLNGAERKEKLLSIGVNWEDIEEEFKYGTIIKKMTYSKLSPQNEIIQRTKFVRIYKKIAYTKKNVQLVYKKALSEGETFDEVLKK